MERNIDVRNPDHVAELNALSGRILSTLNYEELQVIYAFYQHGRKVRIKVNLDSHESETPDLNDQLMRVLKGETSAVPIYKKNTIITITTSAN